MNAIVVYCSAPGNTEKVAQTISNHLNIPINKLESVDPYCRESDYLIRKIMNMYSLFDTVGSLNFYLDHLTPLAANADCDETTRFSSNVDEDEIIEWMNEINLD